MQDLRARIDQLRDRIKSVDAKLAGFTASSGLVDLEKETQELSRGAHQREALFDQARAEKQSSEMQIRKVQSALERAPQESPKEQPLNELNMRAFSRLQNAIHEDQTIRANQAELQAAQIDLDRARQLYAARTAPQIFAG